MPTSVFDTFDMVNSDQNQPYLVENLEQVTVSLKNWNQAGPILPFGKTQEVQTFKNLTAPSARDSTFRLSQNDG